MCYVVCVVFHVVCVGWFCKMCGVCCVVCVLCGVCAVVCGVYGLCCMVCAVW